MSNNQKKELNFLKNSLLEIEKIIDSKQKYNSNKDKEDCRKILRSLLLIANELYNDKAIADKEFKTYYDKIYFLNNKLNKI